MSIFKRISWQFLCVPFSRQSPSLKFHWSTALQHLCASRHDLIICSASSRPSNSSFLLLRCSMSCVPCSEAVSSFFCSSSKSLKSFSCRRKTSHKSMFCSIILCPSFPKCLLWVFIALIVSVSSFWFNDVFLFSAICLSFIGGL